MADKIHVIKENFEITFSGKLYRTFRDKRIGKFTLKKSSLEEIAQNRRCLMKMIIDKMENIADFSFIQS